MDNASFIRDYFQPVLLGNTKEARRLARLLYKKYGVVSYLCDTRRPPFSEHIFAYTFFRVSGPLKGELLSDELLYLFSLDPMPVHTLVPFTDSYAQALDAKKDKLLPACIIRDPDKLFCDFPFINTENGGHKNDASFPS